MIITKQTTAMAACNSWKSDLKLSEITNFFETTIKKMKPPAAIPWTKSISVIMMIAVRNDTNPQQVDFAVILLWSFKLSRYAGCFLETL